MGTVLQQEIRQLKRQAVIYRDSLGSRSRGVAKSATVAGNHGESYGESREIQANKGIMDIVDFANTTAGLLTALGSLIAGFAALWQVKVSLATTQPLEESVGESQMKISTVTVAIGGFGLILIVIALVLFTNRIMGATEAPLNEKLTTEAWRALDRKDYQEAIVNAKECIRNFGVAAKREQDELGRENAPSPPKGKVTQLEKEIIFRRGLLNDVASSYFILGKAFEGLGDLNSAANAYRRAKEFTYARTWDPKGWFWSPSEAASDILSSIE